MRSVGVTVEVEMMVGSAVDRVQVFQLVVVMGEAVGGGVALEVLLAFQPFAFGGDRELVRRSQVQGLFHAHGLRNNHHAFHLIGLDSIAVIGIGGRIWVVGRSNYGGSFRRGRWNSGDRRIQQDWLAVGGMRIKVGRGGDRVDFALLHVPGGTVGLETYRDEPILLRRGRPDLGIASRWAGILSLHIGILQMFQHKLLYVIICESWLFEIHHLSNAFAR